MWQRWGMGYTGQFATDTVPGPEKVSHENQQREYKTQLWPDKHSKKGALSDPCKLIEKGKSALSPYV
ncbi:MAG: hypothetical protein ACJAQU_001598 [Loktanella salsilacus]|jgi:hypothetical protein